jgi:hypothetical protein
MVHLNLNDSDSISNASISLDFHHWYRCWRFKWPKVSNYLRRLWRPARAGRLRLWFQSGPSTLCEDLLTHFDWSIDHQYQMVHRVPIEFRSWDQLGFVATYCALRGCWWDVMLYIRYQVARNLSSWFRLWTFLRGNILQCYRQFSVLSVHLHLRYADPK